MKICPAV